MSEMTTRWQIQSHNAIMRLKQSGVGGKVGRAAWVRLHIHAPLGCVKMKRLKSSRSTQILDVINELVPSIVPVTRHALGVLVGQGAAKCLNDSEGGEVLRCDELDASALAALLPLDQIVDFGIDLDERSESPWRDRIHGGGGGGSGGGGGRGSGGGVQSLKGLEGRVEGDGVKGREARGEGERGRVYKEARGGDESEHREERWGEVGWEFAIGGWCAVTTCDGLLAMAIFSLLFSRFFLFLVSFILFHRFTHYSVLLSLARLGVGRRSVDIT